MDPLTHGPYHFHLAIVLFVFQNAEKSPCDLIICSVQCFRIVFDMAAVDDFLISVILCLANQQVSTNSQDPIKPLCFLNSFGWNFHPELTANNAQAS